MTEHHMGSNWDEITLESESHQEFRLLTMNHMMVLILFNANKAAIFHLINEFISLMPLTNTVAEELDQI